MGGILRAILRPLLQRKPTEIERLVGGFAIADPAERSRLVRLGQTYLGGFHRALDESLEAAAAAGRALGPWERPFWFEGLATGYLASTLWDGTRRASRAEAELLGVAPEFRYLYYVGFGFWHGFRHPRSPASIEALRSAVTPMYFPLCYDGWGFQRGFFRHERDARTIAAIGALPEDVRSAAFQGLGRAWSFVYRDDPEARRAASLALAPRHRLDVETGFALGIGFTRTDAPERVADWIDAADGELLGARLLGVSWALTARWRNDAAWFAACLARSDDPRAALLAELPRRCLEAETSAASYDDWQARTRAAALDAWTGGQRMSRAGSGD